MSFFTRSVLISRPCPSISVADSGVSFSLNLFFFFSPFFNTTQTHRPEEMPKGVDHGVQGEEMVNRERREIKACHVPAGAEEDATPVEPLIPWAGPYSHLGSHMGRQTWPLEPPVTHRSPSDVFRFV